MSIVIVCVDRLPLHMLGPYGSTLFQTPALNSCAAGGFTLERPYVSGDLPYRDLHRQAWLARFADQGWQVSQVSSQCNGLSEATSFASEFENSFLHQVLSLSPAEHNASDWTQCNAAVFTSLAISWLEALQAQDNQCVWLDLPLLDIPWDAPLAWRQLMAGEEDPEILEGVQVPELRAPQASGLASLDPDLRLLWEQACAAQVLLLDHCLEFLMQWLDRCWPETTLVVTAASGFPLGEQGHIGADPASVFSDAAQVPFLFRIPRQPFGIRVPGTQSIDQWLDHLQSALLAADQEGTVTSVTEQLCEPEDLQRQWTQYSLFPDTTDHRGVVMTWTESQLAIRTNHWSFLWIKDQKVQLFVAPDDRLEQNDVSDRCQSLTHLFLRNVGRFGHCLFPNLPPDLWWLQADETLATQESLPDDLELSNDLAQLPDDFWLPAN